MTSEQANAIRARRYANDISEKEWTKLRDLYDVSYHACDNAVKTDPLYGPAWLSLAEAATFAGQNKRAREAFQQAEKLHTDKVAVYWWGLQMFQAKWGGTDEEMTGCIKNLIAWTEKTPYRFSVAQAHKLLYGINLTELADELGRQELSNLKKKIRNGTENPQVYYDYARCLATQIPYNKEHDPKMTSEISYHLKKSALLSKEPQIFAKWFMFNFLEDRKFDLKSALEFSIENNIEHIPFYYYLIDIVKEKSDYEKVISLYNKILSFIPNDDYANHRMAMFYSNDKREYRKSLEYFAKVNVVNLASEMDRSDYYAYYSQSLQYSEQSDKMERQFKILNEAINAPPSILNGSKATYRLSLGRHHLDFKQYQLAEEALRTFLNKYPTSGQLPYAKELLGMALYSQGKKQEAHDLWNTLIKENPSRKSQIERIIAQNPL
jgi:tetratricopeptide (TPR) repeat protein